jgi:hypothetical protein
MARLETPTTHVMYIQGSLGLNWTGLQTCSLLSHRGRAMLAREPPVNLQRVAQLQFFG